MLSSAPWSVPHDDLHRNPAASGPPLLDDGFDDRRSTGDTVSIAELPSLRGPPTLRQGLQGRASAVGVFQLSLVKEGRRSALVLAMFH
jgi:hypothetical protein